MEEERQKTQKKEILGLMLDGKWHTNSELNSIAFRYSSIIYRLRHDGYVIEREGEGSFFRWRIVGGPGMLPTESDGQIRMFA